MLTVTNISTSGITVQGQFIVISGSFTVPGSLERIWLADPVLYNYVSSGLASLGDGVNNYSGNVATQFMQRQLLNLLNPAYVGSYVLPLDMAPATVAQGTSYFAMRNNITGNRIFIRKIVIMGEFVGISSNNNSKFGFYRFSGGTPSTGNIMTVSSVDSTFNTSNLLDARKLNTGLVMTGITVEAQPLCLTSFLNQIGATPPYNVIDDNHEEAECICLNPGEGLVLQAANNLTSGIAIHGYIQWVERP